MNLELLTKQVANTCRSAGSYLKSEIKNLKSSDIIVKGRNDFVTYVDKKSEERLVSDLHKILPEAGFIAEENAEYKKEELYNWVIDPLDGTTNFIHNLPIYSISVALMKGSDILLGVVYEINLQECYYAWLNGGAFLNGHKIQASETKTMDESLLATGFPYHDFDRIEPYLELFKFTLQNSRGIRRLGSAAVDLVYVASGRFDGFYEYGLRPWDVAAGVLIAQEAGCAVSDFSGSNNYIFGGDIIVSNNHIYDEFVKVVKGFFH